MGYLMYRCGNVACPDCLNLCRRGRVSNLVKDLAFMPFRWQLGLMKRL